jgi:hypothetical protein
MKDCVARETSDNSGMSKMDAKKACRSQMKAQQVDPANNGAKYDNHNDANNPSNSSATGMGNMSGTPKQ